MRTIDTKPKLSTGDLAQIRQGFSLYRETHFYRRKPLESLEQKAEQAVQGRVMLPTGQITRLQTQLDTPVTFYRKAIRG